MFVLENSNGVFIQTQLADGDEIRFNHHLNLLSIWRADRLISIDQNRTIDFSAEIEPDDFKGICQLLSSASNLEMKRFDTEDDTFWVCTLAAPTE